MYLGLSKGKGGFCQPNLGINGDILGKIQNKTPNKYEINSETNTMHTKNYSGHLQGTKRPFAAQRG